MVSTFQLRTLRGEEHVWCVRSSAFGKPHEPNELGSPTGCNDEERPWLSHRACTLSHSPHLFVSWLSQHGRVCKTRHTDDRLSLGCRTVGLIGFENRRFTVIVSTNLHTLPSWTPYPRGIGAAERGFLLSRMPSTNLLLLPMHYNCSSSLSCLGKTSIGRLFGTVLVSKKGSGGCL